MSLEGEDLSHWQGTNSVDGAPDFVILKATEGTTYVDPDCDNKYQRAKSEGKLLGVYHFADMGDPTAEANYFVQNITGYIGEAILVLDFETNTNVTWAKTFLDRVQALTGVKPLIYMSASTIKAADWTPVVQGDYGLWVAGYPAKYNVSNPARTDGSDLPYDISPWTFAAIWQYSSSAGALDEDEANMSADAWHKYAAVPTPPAPAPVTPPTPDPTPTPTPEVPSDPTPTPDPVVPVSPTVPVPTDPTPTEPVPEPTPEPTPSPEPVPTPTPDPEPATPSKLSQLVAAILSFLKKVWEYDLKGKL